MSYDRQLDQICPHIVAEEAIFVSPVDRQTVVPLKPVASLNSLVIRYNSSYYLPSGGTMLAASSLGTTVGPFNITTGVNDKMVVAVNQGPNQTIMVPAQQQVTADKLRVLMNRMVTGMAFTSNGMQVGLQSGGLGPAASVFIDPSSTLASTLGITSGREYRGRQIAPGWTLVMNPATENAGRPSRMIVFDEPLKGFNDYVELTYNTIQQDCRRCGGLGVENDWRYGYTGEVAKVVDEQLLRQEIQKIMYTRQGSNPFNSWYGTNLIEAIGKKIASGQVLQNQITSEVTTAFTRWQTIKRQQEQVVGQILTDEEYPYRLVSVSVVGSQDDPTVIYINVVIQNRSSKPIQLARGLILPQPLNLLGSTQQQSLQQQALSGFVLTG